MHYLTAHPFISLAAGFGAALLLLAWPVFSLHRRWAAVFGKKAWKNDDVIAEVLRRTMRAEEQLQVIEPRLATVENISRIAVQRVGFLRFNPFEHTGGDQSFAIALLDGEANGVVVSSLYTREGVRVYAKEIRGGTPRHPLSDEEQRVLEQALNGGNNNKK